MKILFVYPKYPDTFWSFKHVLKFISKKAAFPPLGLMTVASMLPEKWEKKLVDMNVSDLKNEDILWADMVFIGAMIVQKEGVIETIKRCNELGRKVVCGGPIFTTQLSKFKGVDHYVLDEAEVTIPMFVKDVEKGKAKNVYTSSQKPDVTKTPLPMWELIDFKDYSTMTVQYSRGCPFNCEFCDIIVMNGRIPRTKSSEQMISEMNVLYDKGWRGSVFIVDDNFIGNKMHAKQMLKSLIEWQKERKYPFKLFTEASTNLADDEDLMQLMSDANFYKVFLGIETPNIDSLKECKKFQNLTRDLTETIKIIHGYGMQVMGGFIVGFDNDKESIFDIQINFIQQTGVVTAMVGMLSALPKTRLWHRLKEEGRLVKDASGENTDGSLNFIPKMDPELLREGYKRIFSTIYSSKNYYKRINTFLKNYKPSVRSRLYFKDVKAFVKSMWVIGVLSRSRFRYWWLIVKTFFTKRKSFPVAIELAIIGLHFESVAVRIEG